MTTYQLFVGGIEDNSFCAVEDRTPNCSQPHNPIGYTEQFTDYEKQGWGFVKRRLLQLYNKTQKDLVVGDILELTLIPSYSQVQSVAHELVTEEPGFAFDLEIDLGYGVPAVVTGTKLQTISGITAAPAAGTSAALGASAVPTTTIVVDELTIPLLTGGKPGKFRLKVNSVPLTWQDAAVQRFRVNYRNHMECTDFSCA